MLIAAKNGNMKNRYTNAWMALLIGLIFIQAKPDEGMYPMSELHKLDLKKAGLRISATELYNPNGTSLSDAIVRVGGCTGSFISNEGLIITNHHCAFSYAAAVSSTEHDYIKNGFLASTKEQEIPAKGLTCKITASYEDVSARVLDGCSAESDPVRRQQLIAQHIRTITQEENQKNPELSCEISEMFSNRTYVLFRYRQLRDVRLVYVPARSIGEYGGEKDNWVWPRHSGDFAFLRAYVGADGKAADYAASNIPYTPARILKINPAGVKDNDFVFILGYPGRTFRHQPAAFYQYHEQFMLKYVSGLYDWVIQTMENLSSGNRALQIQYASRIKSMANVTKNYKGKLQGFRRAGITASKQQEENEMQQFIAQNETTQKQFGTVIPQINQLYAAVIQQAPRNLWFDYIYNVCPALGVASVVDKLQHAYLKTPDADRKVWAEKQYTKTAESIFALKAKYDTKLESEILIHLLHDAVQFPKELQLHSIHDFLKGDYTEANIRKQVEHLYAKSKIDDTTQLNGLFAKQDVSKLIRSKDAMVLFASALNSEMENAMQEAQQRSSQINVLMAKYVDAKSLWKQSSFIPDANATFRFTYGYVRGYNPDDAIYNMPFTTLKGVIEKEDGTDYELMDIIKKLYKERDYGMLKHPELNDLPVDFLYNLDTTGGNSGSPVMNADGELVGVNFDRAYTATINDYAWNESYSRSVAVDIRYVLFILKKVAGAENILKETHITL